MSEALDDRVKHWVGELAAATNAGGSPVTLADVTTTVGDVGTAELAVIDARVQRALLGLVKARLDANPRDNLLYKKSTGWKILDQLLVGARLKELTRAKIVKRGRSGGLKYDCAELAETFYGKAVLEGLGFGARRRVLDKDEYERVRDEFLKIKLALPEAVEPTTTERFFAGES